MLKEKINKDDDPYRGLEVEGYILEDLIGKGKIGYVYRGVGKNFQHTIACKIIEEGRLKKGWEKELIKVVKLQNVDSVIQYYRHGTSLDKNLRPFTYIFWNYIDGYNLKEFKKQFPAAINLPFIENLADVLIKILFACQKVGIFHGDLHEGNILISKKDERTIDNTTRIYVADFGYGGSHNSIQPKDDVKQFVSIIKSLLIPINKAELTAVDRLLIEDYKLFFTRRFFEKDPLQGNFVGNFAHLYQEFKDLRRAAEIKSSRGSDGQEDTSPGDFLWAEAIGLRKEEWKHLFVPEILGADELLSQNNCVLTGARGCGKTMAFRRLTAFMDKVVGESSGVAGSDSFIGFYINCRDLIEAFPYIPFNIRDEIAAQITHYFHLTWAAEIVKTLILYENENPSQNEWLDLFFKKTFKEEFPILPKGVNILANLAAFIEQQKEVCRLAELGRHPVSYWKLSGFDFLDLLCLELKKNIKWVAEKPVYFFLDDYTIPIVPRNVQRVLNQIIFKRRVNLFFKISSESEFSFEKSTAKGKPLELVHDYVLIDMANISLYQKEQNKQTLLERIFHPRIERHSVLKGKNLRLLDLLGETNPKDNNSLAFLLRDKAQGKYKKKIFYYGMKHFTGMWSSDIRMMIQMFVDMLRESEEQIKSNQLLIRNEIQDKVFRTNGGEFLNFTESVPNPQYLEKQQSMKSNISYGKHLRNIVESFLFVSKYDLCFAQLNGNRSKGVEYFNPKQAFRIEIVDKVTLGPEALNYYEGLIRWHIFFHDFRGKSIRSQINPRLFINRVLIPHGQITFSSRDHIHLDNVEFNMLLLEPKRFQNYWIKKRGRVSGENLRLF